MVNNTESDSIEFKRKLALEAEMIIDDEWHLGEQEGHFIGIDRAAEHFANIYAAFFDRKFEENYNSIKPICDRTCGEHSCQGPGKCPLKHNIIHKMLNDGYGRKDSKD